MKVSEYNEKRKAILDQFAHLIEIQHKLKSNINTAIELSKITVPDPDDAEISDAYAERHLAILAQRLKLYHEQIQSNPAIFSLPPNALNLIEKQLGPQDLVAYSQSCSIFRDRTQAQRNALKHPSHITILCVTNTTACDEKLLTTLKENAAHMIYLFPENISFLPNALEKIDALKLLLEKQGFMVRGIISPIDCAWHISSTTLEKFYNHCALKPHVKIQRALATPAFSEMLTALDDNPSEHVLAGTAFNHLRKNHNLYYPRACRKMWLMETLCELKTTTHDNPREYLINLFIRQHQDYVQNLACINTDLTVTAIVKGGERKTQEQKDRKCVIC